MKKLIALVLALMMVLTLFAGCGSTEAPADDKPVADAPVADNKGGDDAATEDVTLRLWTFLDTTSTTNGRAIVLRKLIENFEASHPGVDIVVETQEWTTRDRRSSRHLHDQHYHAGRSTEPRCL